MRRTTSGARNSKHSTSTACAGKHQKRSMTGSRSLTICEHELEGVVAKRKGSRYRPGQRGWVKIKNREYWRYELEREGAINRTRVKQFV